MLGGAELGAGRREQHRARAGAMEAGSHRHKVHFGLKKQRRERVTTEAEEWGGWEIPERRESQKGASPSLAIKSSRFLAAPQTMHVWSKLQAGPARIKESNCGLRECVQLGSKEANSPL